MLDDLAVSDTYIKQQIYKYGTLKQPDDITTDKIAKTYEVGDDEVQRAENISKSSCTCDWCTQRLKRALKMDY